MLLHPHAQSNSLRSGYCIYGYPILLYGVMLSIACACLLKWEETGVPGGNPRKHGENMQTPHRKARAGPETNPGPSCCEATALTTAPPCRPLEEWLLHRLFKPNQCIPTYLIFVMVITCTTDTTMPWSGLGLKECPYITKVVFATLPSSGEKARLCAVITFYI